MFGYIFVSGIILIPENQIPKTCPTTDVSRSHDYNNYDSCENDIRGGGSLWDRTGGLVRVDFANRGRTSLAGWSVLSRLLQNAIRTAACSSFTSEHKIIALGYLIPGITNS